MTAKNQINNIQTGWWGTSCSLLFHFKLPFNYVITHLLISKNRVLVHAILALLVMQKSTHGHHTENPDVALMKNQHRRAVQLHLKQWQVPWWWYTVHYTHTSCNIPPTWNGAWVSEKYSGNTSNYFIQFVFNIIGK